MTDTIRTLWKQIADPRHMSILYGGIYTIVLFTGIVTLLVPPQSVAGELGRVLTIVWSVALIVGGTGGMITVLPGWWWAERLSLLSTGAGIGIYGVVVFSLHFSGTGSRLTQIGMILLALSTFVVRFLMIRKYSFAPQLRE